MEWEWENKTLQEEDIKEYVGFVYEIQNLIDYRKYIGKKNFTRSKIYQKNKKRRRKRVESNWKDYYGSSDILLKDLEKYGKENFRRKILHLCKTKSEMSYLEAKEQFLNDAIISEEYYNDWISVRIRRTHLKKDNNQ